MTNIRTDLKMTMSGRYLLAQLDILNDLGFSYKESYQALEFNKSRLGNGSQRVPVAALLPVFKAAEIALDNPLIGLEVGFRFRIGNFAQTGAIYSYCENLRQVIGLNQRYQRLAIDIAHITYLHNKGSDGEEHHYMQFTPYYHDHEKYRHITDMVMGSYGTTYRWLSWGSGEDIKGVHLPYDKPKDMNLYERVFQSKVSFSTPLTALEFSPAMMIAPLTTHDPEKLAALIAQLDKMTNASEAQLSLKTAVETAMKAALQKGSISITIIANRLNRTERQLRIDMKKAGMSYRHMLDSIRQDLFFEYYKNGESFASIAQYLAYNDQAAFNRAFRRWYDMSPGEWAAKNLTEETA